MKIRTQRRIWSCCAITVLAIALLLIDPILKAAHFYNSFFSGWVLLGMILFLTAFGIRKKVSFLPASMFPVGKASTWFQLHIYVGLLTSVIFAIHIGFQFPNGLVERTLALFYLGTFLSGVTGLVFSRFIPRRLTARGEEVLFERIPIFRRSLLDQLKALTGADDDRSAPSAITEVCEAHLYKFFAGPRNVLSHLIFSNRPRSLLLQQVYGCRAYLDAAEENQLDQIVQLVKKKDDLDYHYSLQGVLKVWLFVHLPLTYGLLIFTIFHVLLVHAFT